MHTVSLQELRRRIYHKAKSEKHWRFWGLYVHICRMDTLTEAYRMAKANDGAPGVDGQTFEAIEAEGLEKFLIEIHQELTLQIYKPQRSRQVEIPKANSKKMRKLGIPTIKDRVVEGATRLILEPIFETDFCDNTFGYRPKRNCAQALHRVTGAVVKHGMSHIIDIDLSSYFDHVCHNKLLAQIDRRVNDDKVMKLLNAILKGKGKKGVVQGSPLSPLLANLYLSEVDRTFEKAELKTRLGWKSRILYTRFSDDIIIAVGEHPRWPNLKEHTLRRLQEELNKLEVQINERKTKIVDLIRGESFNYLGFDCRLVKSRRGKRLLLTRPQAKKRSELLGEIRQIIRKSGNLTTQTLVQKINPVLAGWVNYFRIGHSSRTFQYVQKHVETRVRRFAMRRRLYKGFGWKRWSNWILYGEWRLFNDYAIRYYRPSNESTLQLIGI